MKNISIEMMCKLSLYRQSKMPSRWDYMSTNIRLRSNRLVKLKNILKRNYNTDLKSLMSRGIKIWDTLTIELQHTLSSYVYVN